MSHFIVTCLTTTGSKAELEALLDPYDENQHLEEVTDEDGETYKRNPDAKWDWWEIGGRWPNRLLLTDGRRLNRSTRDLLAVDAMRAEAVAEAEAEWAKMDAAFRDLPGAMTWGEVRELYGDDLQTARQFFWAQERLQAMKAVDDWNAGDLVEDYQGGYERFMERSRLIGPAFVGYATVSPEGWIGRGEMGWFGCGSDTTESSIAYGRTINQLIDDLPGDAWITMIDCHI